MVRRTISSQKEALKFRIAEWFDVIGRIKSWGEAEENGHRSKGADHPAQQAAGGLAAIEQWRKMVCLNALGVERPEVEGRGCCYTL